MDATDARDRLLQAHTPAIMVPRFGALAPLAASGHRYLVAESGLWLEVRRPWLHLVWPIALTNGADDPADEHAPAGPRLPFGALEPVMDVPFTESLAFRGLLERFVEDARAAFPDEAAAWLVYDEERRALAYTPLVITEASPSSVSFHRPALAAHEHLAVDLHSHGALHAGFSETDDLDDAGETKLAYVLGRVGCPDEHWAARLCAQGLYITLDGGESA